MLCLNILTLSDPLWNISIKQYSFIFKIDNVFMLNSRKSIHKQCIILSSFVYISVCGGKNLVCMNWQYKPRICSTYFHSKDWYWIGSDNGISTFLCMDFNVRIISAVEVKFKLWHFSLWHRYVHHRKHVQYSWKKHTVFSFQIIALNSFCVDSRNYKAILKILHTVLCY